ncbi:MAG: protein-glutamate O-methyltransferase CheR [bacterium]
MTIGTEEDALEFIRRHVHENYGIYFPDEKLYSLKSKLERRMTKVDCESLRDYADYLQGNPDEIPFFLDAITTNKTYFFREPNHWKYFEEHLIPAWKDQSEVRIWSAACSSGEEPYTASILMEEALRQGIINLPSDYKVLGSDVSEQVLRVGSRGIYSRDQVQKVREYRVSFAEHYFEEDEQSNYRVSESLQNHVYFRQFNLVFNGNPFRKQFDLILLRNVLIYFDQEMIQNVIRHCEQLLSPGGYLFIGHTETIREIDHTLEKQAPSIFQKNV